jgi:hypothetical protein
MAAIALRVSGWAVKQAPCKQYWKRFRRESFIEKNDINLNKLVNLAVKEFISKPHTIELEPVSELEWDKLMKKSYKKYKKTMDELAK